MKEKYINFKSLKSATKLANEMRIHHNHLCSGAPCPVLRGSGGGKLGRDGVDWGTFRGANTTTQSCSSFSHYGRKVCLAGNFVSCSPTSCRLTCCLCQATVEVIGVVKHYVFVIISDVM